MLEEFVVKVALLGNIVLFLVIIIYKIIFIALLILIIITECTIMVWVGGSSLPCAKLEAEESFSLQSAPWLLWVLMLRVALMFGSSTESQRVPLPIASFWYSLEMRLSRRGVAALGLRWLFWFWIFSFLLLGAGQALGALAMALLSF